LLRGRWTSGAPPDLTCDVSAPGRPGVQTVRPGACPLDGGRRAQPYDQRIGGHAGGWVPLCRHASPDHHRDAGRGHLRRVRHQLRW
jgi:hypothetical protein